MISYILMALKYGYANCYYFKWIVDTFRRMSKYEIVWHSFFPLFMFTKAVSVPLLSFHTISQLGVPEIMAISPHQCAPKFQMNLETNSRIRWLDDLHYIGWMDQTPAPNHSAVNFHQNNVIPWHTWGNKLIEIENVCYLQHICF